jgi:hypothetical protein
MSLTALGHFVSRLRVCPLLKDDRAAGLLPPLLYVLAISLWARLPLVTTADAARDLSLRWARVLMAPGAQERLPRGDTIS